MGLNYLSPPIDSRAPLDSRVHETQFHCRGRASHRLDGLDHLFLLEGIRDEVQLRDPLRSNGSVSRAWFGSIWMGPYIVKGPIL